ncbi:nucleotidyltransferase family protein [Halobacteria archaeon AArc-dxtr1]|nr:nucleotidyltransferase family protein [Halobacteria archaeon AArc-dxtr1]
MDAVVLAGGDFSRMWPGTDHRPKMFLPIDGTTIIDRIFGELERDPRIETVYVLTNREFAPEIDAHLADAPYEKPTVVVETAASDGSRLGVIGALAQLTARESLDDALVIAGDNYVSFAISDFLDAYQDRAGPTIAAYDRGTTDRASNYGVIDVDDGRVTAFREKPAEPDSSLISIACYGLPADALASLEPYLEAGNDPEELGAFIGWLLERRPVSAFPVDGAWFDVETPGSYLDAISHHLDGATSIAASATVENCSFGTNVHVMAGAELVDSTLERAVVFPDAEVTDATISDTVLDQCSVVEGVSIADSVVASYSVIR